MTARDFYAGLILMALVMLAVASDRHSNVAFTLAAAVVGLSYWRMLVTRC